MVEACSSSSNKQGFSIFLRKIGDKSAQDRQKFVKQTGITSRAGIELVERGDNGGNEAVCLDGSATHRPRESERGASASPHLPVHTLSGELPIRTLAMEGLPPPTTKRWVVRRKAAVVAAVLSGEITVEEACRFYQLSEEEFRSWERAFETHGLAGLRITRTQQYRVVRPARSRSSSLKQVQSSPLRRAKPAAVLC